MFFSDKPSDAPAAAPKKEKLLIFGDKPAPAAPTTLKAKLNQAPLPEPVFHKPVRAPLSEPVFTPPQHPVESPPPPPPSEQMPDHSDQSQSTSDALSAATTGSAPAPLSTPVPAGGAAGSTSAAARRADKPAPKRYKDALAAAAGDEPARKNLNVVFIGHVDAGKSTISGHLMFDIGNIDPRLLEKFEMQAKQLNRESWKYAFAMDTSEEEREKGKTVECARASFLTPSDRRITILDAPGHKGYVHNMISGTAQADVAILIVSARKGEFETGFVRGGQTSEHALISYVCGIKQIVCVVNKMDDPTVGYDRGRYDHIVAEMTRYLTESVGYARKNIYFLPASGYTGENLICSDAERGRALRTKAIDEETGAVVEVPVKCTPLDARLAAWYSAANGYECCTLVELLERIRLPKRDTRNYLRACVSGKYRDGGSYVICKLEVGRLRTGEVATVMPGEKTFEVQGIEDELGVPQSLARAGDNVRLRVKDDAYTAFDVGSVICPSHLDRANGLDLTRDDDYLVAVTDTFVIKLIVVDHPNVVTKGFACVLHLNLEQMGCTVDRLLAILDPKTGKVCERAPAFVKPGQQCLCQVRTSKPICVSEFNSLEALGRVLLRHESLTIGIGLVVKLR